MTDGMNEGLTDIWVPDQDGEDTMYCIYDTVANYLLTLERENEALKRCNKCMKYQLDNKTFPCAISSDGDCGWTKLNNYDALEGRR